MMKNLIFITSFLFTFIFVPRFSISGGIAVIDISNLEQNIQMVMNSMTQISRLTEQIGKMSQMISNQKQNLKVDSGLFPELDAKLWSQSQASTQISSDVRALSFELNKIEREFYKFFPSRWKEIPAYEYDRALREWQNEILHASKLSMNAQSSISRAHQNQEAISEILKKSKASEGSVRQLQSVVMSLSVLSSQINDLTDTLVTSARLSSTISASQASKAIRQREFEEHLIKNYTSKGKIEKRYNRLP